MRTSGRGNDTLLILVPIAVSVVVGVVLAGGPANAIDTLNAIVRDAAHEAIATVRAWF